MLFADFVPLHRRGGRQKQETVVLKKHHANKSSTFLAASCRSFMAITVVVLFVLYSILLLDEFNQMMVVTATTTTTTTTTTAADETMSSRYHQSCLETHLVSITSPGGKRNNATLEACTHTKSSNNSTTPLIRRFRDNALVLLVQKEHSTYKERHHDNDNMKQLVGTLDRLFQNYFLQGGEEHPYLKSVDIFLFHTGDFDVSDLRFLESKLLPRIGSSSHVGVFKLVNLFETPFWTLPHNLIHDNPSDWLDSQLFPIGYRHMCRWFAVKLWDFFDELNRQHGTSYRYIWRMDDDSLLHSPIKYDLFDYMKQNEFVYGYRMCTYELDHNQNILPNWFDRWHSQVTPIRPIHKDLCAFYNNFFVADLHFFKSKQVQSFLKNEIDRRGFLYRKRYGDLLVHSMAVYAFAQPTQIHRFLDFTYEHVTVDHRVDPTGCVVWGGIQEGYLDPHVDVAMQEFQQKYGGDDQGESGPRCNVSEYSVTYKDLSPTYSRHHNSTLTIGDFQPSKISLRTIAAGKVELIGKGDFSG